MTKQEILGVLSDPRVKVRHTSFTATEWIQRTGTGTHYQFEDGKMMRIKEFWEFRQHENFKDGWDVLE